RREVWAAEAIVLSRCAAGRGAPQRAAEFHVYGHADEFRQGLGVGERDWRVYCRKHDAKCGTDGLFAYPAERCCGALRSDHDRAYVSRYERKEWLLCGG